MELKGKKVVLLGASGFLGKRIVHALLHRGAHISCFDLSFPEYALEGVDYFTGDFFNDKELFEAIGNADIVIHAICTINPGNSSECYIRGYEKDLLQSVKLCENAITNGRRLLFLSSGGTVYGEAGVLPVKEEAPLNPINHYGSLKACIETIMRVFMRMGGDIRIARIANPYGPGQDYRRGVGFIDAAIKHTIAKETIEVWGDGSIIRDYIYVDDACELLCDILEYEGNESVFNVSSGIGVSQKDILAILRDIVPSINVEYRLARNVDVPCIVLDNRRVLSIKQRELMNIKSGIKTYYEYLSQIDECTIGV